MRRWIPPIAGAVAFLVGLGLVAAAPAEAGRLARALYGSPLGGSQSEVVRVREGLDASVDGAVRFFAFGDADKLIDWDLRLVASDPPPQAWHGERTLRMSWTDLGSAAIRYEVFVGEAGAGFASGTMVATLDGPEATVEAPQDGRLTVWVRPRTDRLGRVTPFGPFLVDASPPPAPQLDAPAEPPGYRFRLSWNAVSDLSGVDTYELQRRPVGGTFQAVAKTAATEVLEDQVGNGEYEYRVRAVNGAGVPSAWSPPARVVVKAPLRNPGPGQFSYGIHANYTGFLHLWDLSQPEQFLSIHEVPQPVKAAYLAPAPGIETGNATLRQLVEATVGGETNTLRLAEKLFVYLFDHTDYDASKAAQPDSDLQRAGETLDRGKGICGDLAVLYVTLLRIAGVPARPVHGYLDNALSGIGGFHMWVEVYVGPVGGDRPWMSVDVSGVTGTFEPEDLFPYFGLFNPDYLALGTELNYDRFADGQWNTWARFRHVRPAGTPAPKIVDDTRVVDYESEHGRLFFDPATKRTHYRACVNPDATKPENPCPSEPPPPGFTRFYGVKGLSKKRIDYGARLESALPSCLKVELRYPMADAYGAVVPDQSAIFQPYENSSSQGAQVGSPDAEGWVTFLDGTNVPGSCGSL